MPGKAALSRKGAVAEIAFSNPDAGLMDEAMEAALLEAVETVEADDGVAACVLIGADPGVFIRHYDVKVLSERAAAMRAKGYVFREDRPIPEAPLHKAMRLMEEGRVAYVAALNGTAMGGGFELALAADLRLAAAGDHRFGLPEINLGLLPGAGGTQRLPRLIGEARALDMMLTGRTLDPREMAAIGLASEVCADVAAAAAALASRIAAKPARARARIKRLARGLPQGDVMGAERALFCDLMVSDEAMRLMAEAAAGERAITDEPD